MITEQDKQAILNGACGITRDGNKAKLLFQSDKNPIDSKYLFLIYRKDGHDDAWLNEQLQYFDDSTCRDDVVGLWQNKP
ncbi:hypothetical protein CBG46_10120 [Actinobacillus succinogenes]|uniref:hypothetical protein n=1 Tax=Actinobacillus succinogenes TaxID=67854 RepID=UPI0005A2B31F|nr:hypothetical protein [Actinobacillus succinogenes]PHI41010.1 hypothetical protein CBG46_10120 [Actinobacillus succinogenes]